MAAYINVSYNHFLAIQRWALETGGSATMDFRDMSLEVKHRGRYYRMFPMFQGKVNGRLVHLPNMTPEVRGFGGWRPYPTLTHPHSNDKQLFKTYLQECGLRCPASWPYDGTPPEVDYVLKARSGSFGLGLFGPYHAGTAPRITAESTAPHGDMFAEQFVQGRMLKVWFWGARPFFAHMQDYPVITGTGRDTVRELVERRIGSAGLEWDGFEQRPVVLGCLAFQGLRLEDTLPEGQTAWIDYRYSQVYAPAAVGSPVSDDRLAPLAELSGDQLLHMGEALARLLRQTLPAPVLITADGVLDAEGRIWWLEMNTNSLMPPEGYATMFADLFP